MAHKGWLNVVVVVVAECCWEKKCDFQIQISFKNERRTSVPFVGQGWTPSTSMFAPAPAAVKNGWAPVTAAVAVARTKTTGRMMILQSSNKQWRVADCLRKW